jgi:hypothetical protein
MDSRKQLGSRLRLRFGIALDEAISRQTDVKIEGWINEWDIVNKDESVPEKRFRLYTLIRENPRLSCAPDAALPRRATSLLKVPFSIRSGSPAARKNRHRS